jgi:DnaJ-class molecular chaperone
VINLYALLEVGSAANGEELRSAFRRLAREYHPDHNPNGGERFVAIEKAYRILKDRELRREYDAQFFAWQAAVAAEEAAGAGPRQRRRKQAKAERLHHAVSPELQRLLLDIAPDAARLIQTAITRGIVLVIRRWAR